MLKNNITLVGNMGSEAKITQFENGAKVARFSFATDKNFRSESGKVKKDTEWHRLFAWGSMAEIIENYGDKGKPLTIQGRLVNRTYLSPKGLVRKVTEIEVRNILLMNGSL
jgi:single-strand DNA-binding protein